MFNPREQNPSITEHEVDVVTRIHDYIDEKYHGTDGYCGLGALMVVDVLGPNYVLVHGPGHWWAANKTTFAILDPTVDQFESLDWDAPKPWPSEHRPPVRVSGEAEARRTRYPQSRECTWVSVMMHYDDNFHNAQEFLASLKIAVQRRVAA